MYKDHSAALIGGCLSIIIIAAALFIEPAIVLHAWNLIAVQRFNLPTFSYWECWWFCLAIGILFSHPSTSYSSKSNS